MSAAHAVGFLRQPNPIPTTRLAWMIDPKAGSMLGWTEDERATTAVLLMNIIPRSIFCLLFALTAVNAEAQDAMQHHHHQHQAVQPATVRAIAPDNRAALGLSPAAREGLLQTMREHLEAIQSIVAALAAGDYDGAATVAREELGFAKHHQAMQREQNAAFPPRYQELAMAHHQAADDLADVIAKRDLPVILQALESTIAPCTTCHREYKP